MNTQKYKVATQCGLLREADRSLYRDENGAYKDTVSRSNIDFSKSNMNYNLCPHKQYTQKQIKEYIEKITGKTMRKDAVWGSTIISQPKDYDGDSRTFFATAYEGLKEIYQLTDDDIISAYCHTDEGGSFHCHLYFIPHWRDQDKEGVAWGRVMPRSMYQKQHKLLEEYINQQPYFANNGYKVRLLNGETLGIGDVNKLSRADKIAHQKRVQATEEELTRIKAEFVRNELQPLRERYNTLKRLYNNLLDWIYKKLPKVKELATKTEHKSIVQGVQKLHTSLYMDDLDQAILDDKALDKKWSFFASEYEDKLHIKSL